MNSLRHIIYNIRTLIKDRHSDDIKFSDSNIEYWIKYIRARLIRQEVNSNQTIGDSLIQEVIIPMEVVDSGSKIDIESNTPVLKSSIKIPKFINTHKRDLFLSVSSPIDDSFVITIQPRAKAIRNKYNKYGKKYPVAYLYEGYIYIIKCDFYIEDILISGVFQDPFAVEKLKNPDLTEEDFMDMDYPIDDDMINQINDIIKSNELNLYFQIPEDKVNDAQTNSL